MKTFEKWIVGGLIIFGVFLRLVSLESYPISLNVDEVAIGYNAYSILKTGKDEYGTTFPIAFRSHDDYKAPLYIYLTTIPIALFGLNGFSVRIISVVAGSLALWLTYLLVQEVVRNKKKYTYLPLVVTFLLSISPWHIQFSRGGFETNLATTLVIGGVLLFIKGMRQPKLWLGSAFLFSLSLYAYHSNKVFLPMLAIFIFLKYLKVLKSHMSMVLASLFVGLLVAALLIPFSLSQEGQLRFKGTSLFENSDELRERSELKLDLWRDDHEYQAKVFHSKYLVGTEMFLDAYFTHFRYNFLFTNNQPSKVNHTPNVGLLYLWEIPFLLIGIYALFKEGFTLRWFIVAWLLLVPVASGLTWDVPSATRTAIGLPTWQILTGLGLYFSVLELSRNEFKWIFGVVISGIISFNFAYYLHNYYVVAPLQNAKLWDYGVSEVVGYVQEHTSDNDQVIVSTNVRQPQNFFAFYSQYDPKTYIETDGGTVSGGFEETKNAFGRYEFHPIDWDALEDGSYYVEYADKLKNGIEVEFMSTYPNGEDAIAVFRK